MSDLSCCPKCKRILSSKDFFNSVLIGALDSILPTFTCSTCNYQGIAISVSIEDYEKWINENTE